jgi:CRP/FNR family transcriptional regulator
MLEEGLALLGKSSLCRDIPPELVAALGRRAVLLNRLRGEELYREGAPASTLYLVVRGVLKLVHALETGRDVILELAGRGDVIGEAALSDDGVYGARAVCVHPSTMLAIPREDVAAFVAANPAAVRNVVALLHACVRRAQRRVDDLAVFGVRQRIARHLIRMAEWTGREENGRVVIPVALSRQELAALVGTTMETAIRVMTVLRQQGLVEPARRGVVLNDRAGLEALAGGAP